MKIVHSIGAKFAGDGIGYIAYQLVSGIYKRGYLKKVIAPDFVPSEIDDACCLRMVFPGIAAAILSRFMSPSRRYLIRDRLFDWNVSFNLPDADIFHCWSSQALLSMRRAKGKGQATFLERANSYPLTLLDILTEEYRMNSIKLCPTDPILLNTQLKECEESDFVIVPSDFAYSSFLKHGFDAARLVLVPFGVDDKKFRPRIEPRTDTVFRVVYTGQVGIRKGVHYLMEAWSQLKLSNAELVLVGWLHPDILNILKRYSDIPGLVIKSFTPDLEAVYHSASVCVFPSIEDGFGLVVLEAMASGVPVIVTENTGAKDAVTQGEDGFVIPIRDVEALKEKILYFYDKPEECRRMGGAAAKKAKLHTWESCSGTLLAAYEKCIQKILIE